MEEYIYQIISKYIDRDEIITKAGLRSILYIYKNMNNLQDYIQKLNFTEYNDKFASYGSNTVNYNYEKHVDQFESLDLFDINFSMVASLLHEMKHSEHRRIMDNMRKDPYNRLIGVDPYSMIYNLLIADSYYYFDLDLNETESFKLRMFENDEDNDLNNKFMDLYHKNHDLFPDERFCNIEAYEYLKSLVCKYEKDEDKIKRYLNHLDSQYYLHLIKDYIEEENGFVLSPVENFIRKFSFEDHRDLLISLRKVLEKRNPYDKLSIMKLGLLINNSTLHNMIDYSIYVYDESEQEKVR